MSAAEGPGPPGEFCVVCGRTDVPLVEAVCADCYARSHPLVTAPAHSLVVLCPTCGARLVRSHWERAGSSTMLAPEDLLPILRSHEEVGIRKVEWDESGRNPLLREMRAVVHLRFRGTERTVAVEFPVHIEHRTCPDCSRKSGHYYTALIQLRGPEGRPVGRRHDERPRLHRLWDRALAEARPEWRTALSWEEARPEGWDFYLVDTVSARSLARWLKARWGASLSESPSLYGRKDGRDIYRVTYCLRVPRAPAGGDAGPSGRPERRARAPA
jgi:nonsense-mediated mRNA decay protein 3